MGIVREEHGGIMGKILAAIGGFVVLIVIIMIASGGGDKKGGSGTSSTSSPTPASPVPSSNVDISRLGPPQLSAIAGVPVPQGAIKRESSTPETGTIFYELFLNVKPIELNEWYGRHMPIGDNWTDWKWCRIDLKKNEYGVTSVMRMYERGQPVSTLSVTTTNIETGGPSRAAIIVGVRHDGKSCKP